MLQLDTNVQRGVEDVFVAFLLATLNAILVL